MDILMLIGRILFGGFFLMTGIRHFKDTKGLTEYARAKGVPSPQFSVYLSGLLIILGGAGVILGFQPQIALALIIIFLLPVTFQMHAFWRSASEEKQADMQNFLKNMALLGAALMLILSASGGWPLSL